jgi:hypothetical protein
MVKNLESKINIQYFKSSVLPPINNNTFIICDKILKIERSHDNLISAIKYILNINKCMIYRTDILKNLCKNIPIIIISSGPSSNIDFVKLREKENEYIILTVKYVRDILLHYDITIDFTLTSSFHDKNFDIINPNETKTISLHMDNKYRCVNRIYMKDILFTPVQNRSMSHLFNFNKSLSEKNVDIFNIIPNKIKSDYCLFNLAYPMLEVAIPISVFIGCNHIHTFGWDGPIISKDNKMFYTYNPYLSFKSFVVDKMTMNKCEYPYVKKISDMYREKNIEIYKCNILSNINLKYKKIIHDIYENLSPVHNARTNYLINEERLKNHDDFVRETLSKYKIKFKKDFDINHFLTNLNKFSDNIILNDNNLHELFSNVKSIALCGNGPYGYYENISDKIIDNCDKVVRMNEFKLVDRFTGVKTHIHFISSSLCEYTIEDKEDIKYMASINNLNKLKNKYEKLESKKLIICNSIVIEELLNKYFKLESFQCNLKITGLLSTIYYYLICKKYNIKDFYIYGIHNHELNEEGKQIYIDKVRDPPNNDLHKSHNFYIQELIIDKLIDKNTMKVHSNLL